MRKAIKPMKRNDYPQDVLDLVEELHPWPMHNEDAWEIVRKKLDKVYWDGVKKGSERACESLRA